MYLTGKKIHFYDFVVYLHFPLYAAAVPVVEARIEFPNGGKASMKRKIYRWILICWGRCNGHIYHLSDGTLAYLVRFDLGRTHWQTWIPISQEDK
jgi:hypothetical protein